MMNRIYLLLFVLLPFWGYTQVDSLHYVKKKVAVRDSISFYQVSTNPYYFRLSTSSGELVNQEYYTLDSGNSVLYLKQEYKKRYTSVDSLIIHFYTYPDYLTKTYRGMNPDKIINTKGTHRLISMQDAPNTKLKTVPFSGLDTQGKIIRGVTVGNNQDAVLHSVLDLTIAGKLSSKVSLRARINDTNIPIQENGYSQDLKDLDRVYMEIEGPKWSIKAGDIFLQNQATYFMNFNKKVAGVSVTASVDSVDFVTSGALVKGRFTTYQFQGQEANQGPYKLKGNNGEAYIFIINGSEKVYINGLLQKRGEAFDYILDYNAAEITFTPTKPITSDMRIRIEYQYSDRNYTRFVTNNSVKYKGDKLQVGAYFYRESDVKTQPIQSLTEDQIALLSSLEATGEQVLVPNVVETMYTEGAILYRKIIQGADVIYEYSTAPSNTLFQVGFTFVGTQQGDYKVQEFLANGKVMEYVGSGNGDYVAATPLIAPSRQQMAVINADYHPSNKTNLDVELAYSNNDSNLFSSLGNESNKAPAVKIQWQQSLLDTTATGWQLQGQLHYDFLHRNFKSLERVFSVEFNRDWNLNGIAGNQSLLSAQLQLTKKEKVRVQYKFENLNFSDNYKGNRHQFQSDFDFNALKAHQNSSFLESEGLVLHTRFLRSNTLLQYQKKRWWANTSLDFEQNLQRNVLSDSVTNLSYRYRDLQARLGIGDTTKVFATMGLAYRVNDSLRNTSLSYVNSSHTWFVNSQLIKEKNRQLGLYVNYRSVTYKNALTKQALNSKIYYTQKLFHDFMAVVSQYQNKAGSIPEQEYKYIETNQGQGYYTWIDYNDNGIQELDEFEIAQFVDQANYLRIALPNIQYIPTQEAGYRQLVVINFSKWSQREGILKFVSHWSNQLQIDAKNNKRSRQNTLHLNPFSFSGENILSVQYNLRNSLYFNRGKEHFSVSYHYTDLRQKTVRLFNTQEFATRTHQFLFQHKVIDNWHIGFTLLQAENSSISDTFTTRNFDIETASFSPNILYRFAKRHWIKSTYSRTRKENFTGDVALLKQQQLSLDYVYENTKETRFSINIKYLNNAYTGTEPSAISYQMLEGLKSGNNLIINTLWSAKINSFLFLNLNYTARATPSSGTIHNGNIQLRAQF